MRCERWLVPLGVALLLSNVSAQIRGGAAGNVANLGSLHIHVVFSNEHSAGPYLLVQLMDGSSDNVVSTTYTNDLGQADFVATVFCLKRRWWPRSGIRIQTAGPWRAQ